MKEKYLKFVTRFRSVEIQADFFGVSVATVRKWQVVDSKIPRYVFKIIDKQVEIELLEVMVHSKKLKIKAIENDLKIYFNSIDTLKTHIK